MSPCQFNFADGTVGIKRKRNGVLQCEQLPNVRTSRILSISLPSFIVLSGFLLYIVNKRVREEE